MTGRRAAWPPPDSHELTEEEVEARRLAALVKQTTYMGHDAGARPSEVEGGEVWLPLVDGEEITTKAGPFLTSEAAIECARGRIRRIAKKERKAKPKSTALSNDAYFDRLRDEIRAG